MKRFGVRKMDSGKEPKGFETENPLPADTSPKTHENSPTAPNAKHLQSPMELETYDYIPRASDLLISVSVRADVNKHKITNLVISAMEEIRQLVIEQEALWVFDMEAGTCSLNVGEYKRRFSPLDPTLDEIVRMIKTQEPILGIPNLNAEVEILPEVGSACLEREASRDIAVVCMNPVNLVQMFMDVVQWSRMFSSIVSKAEILEVISEGKGSSLDGALQVMTAEFHISSPLVQTRESYFARYCKQLSVNVWAVVDVSLESIFPNPTARFLRRPSGCFIQPMGNGYSKVLWIEHLEVDNTLVHRLFKPLVTSGLAFGAKRWLGTMACQCDRLASYMDDRVPIMQDGRKSILKLADRMTRSYHAGVSSTASPENTWKPIPISGAGDVLVTTSYNDDDPETPRGVSITVATTIWLPNQPKNVFEFLRNEDHRSQWDLLCLKRCSQEATRVCTGHDPANCVSIIKIDTLPLIFYLQESQTTSTGSYVVYAPVDLFTMNSVLSGDDPDNVQILASGFAVLPDRPRIGGEENCGTLLTIAIRVVDQHSSTPEYLPPISVLTVYTIITQTVQLIRAAITQ
ncbi:homeobox-leucine zipper protein PROTODERMAL FACTOR 2-like [Rhododendron vialii]|uniref:homeobox-leucine zipper protein PROTODERMAL FACTOR 2-like n=1 Tax=Rhododendron vialii TaxID=182163 RepID=UPI00265F5CE1|nr:homeobox-leucine zipper protein PROTODERMAL FACTOR 2-like [Rhododendron vialii]